KPTSWSTASTCSRARRSTASTAIGSRSKPATSCGSAPSARKPAMPAPPASATCSTRTSTVTPSCCSRSFQGRAFDMKRHLLAAAILFTLTAPVTADDQAGLQYQNLLTPLLQGGVDVLGNPLRYPEGDVNIPSAIVTIPPGGTTGLHRHEVPLFAHILEGELTVDYGEGRINTYR